MDEQLIKKMQMITAEERAYLDGDAHVKKDIYTKKNNFEVDCQLFLQEGKLITVRCHSRFVELPVEEIALNIGYETFLKKSSLRSVSKKWCISGQ